MIERRKAIVLVVWALPILLLLFNSCSDKCKEIICYNGGFCLDGTCGCTTGFEGNDCSLEVREKFLGTYNVQDHCSITGENTYTVNIGPIDTNVAEVQIANFNNDFSNLVTANISGINIEIPVQTPDNDGRSVSGVGIFNNGFTIIWNYTIVSSAGIPNDCTNSVWIK